MDVITLSGLQYHAKHGFYQKERTDGNNFEVDVVFHTDLENAGATDDLAATIDYQQAEEIIREVMEGPSVKLIEKLTYNIGEKLFAHFLEATRITVRLRKLDPPLQTPAAYAQISKTWKRP